MDEHASDRTQRTIAVGLMVAIVGVAVAGMLWMTLGGGAAWLVGHVRDVETQVATNPAVALATFGVVVFLIQLVSLPGGTVAVLGKIQHRH